MGFAIQTLKSALYVFSMLERAQGDLMKIEAMNLPETVSFKVDDIEFHSYVTGGTPYREYPDRTIHWHGHGGLKYLPLQSLGSSLCAHTQFKDGD